MPKTSVSFFRKGEMPLLPLEKGGKRLGIFPISVGQSYHERKQFRNTMEQAGIFFSEVIILVADTLQRYTWRMKLDKKENGQWEHYPEGKALEEALRAGQAWVNDKYTKVAFGLLQKAPEIVFWDTFLCNNAYEECFKCIKEAFTSNRKGFKAYVTLTMLSFMFIFLQKEGINTLARKVSSGCYPNAPNKIDVEHFVAFRMEHAEEQCIQYLLEESAVMLMFGREWGNCNIVYPVTNSPLHQDFFECLNEINKERGGEPFELVDTRFGKAPNKNPTYKNDGDSKSDPGSRDPDPRSREEGRPPVKEQGSGIMQRSLLGVSKQIAQFGALNRPVNITPSDFDVAREQDIKFFNRELEKHQIQGVRLSMKKKDMELTLSTGSHSEDDKSRTYRPLGDLLWTMFGGNVIKDKNAKKDALIVKADNSDSAGDLKRFLKVTALKPTYMK